MCPRPCGDGRRNRRRTASGRPERPCVGLPKDDLVKKGGQIDAARLELGRAVQQVSPASSRQLSGNAD